MGKDSLMQVENQRRMPVNLRKKLERDNRYAEEEKKENLRFQEQNKKNQEYYLQQGRLYYEQNRQNALNLVNQKREAKSNSSFFVEEQPKFYLVVRIKGIRKVPPKERKILQLFRLRQIGNAVFLKNNKSTMNMLRRIEPWVTYGRPSLRVVRNLVYKRGYGNNNNVETGLGEFNIRCLEDLINEIHNFGEHFKQAVNFLWPFKLNAPRGGFAKKR